VAVALTGHARAEAGHHLMMRADVRSLAARWNARREPAVDADKLLNQTLSPGVLHYRKVHEENIAGETPYAQIAIEYEVEMLPLRYGEPLLSRCVKMLGAEILPCLSFVTEHIVLDVGHTNFNARLLAKVMGLSASSMPALVSAGTAALDAYAEFLGDCVQLANCDSRKTRTSMMLIALLYHGSCTRPSIEGATAARAALYPTGSRTSGRFAAPSFSTSPYAARAMTKRDCRFRLAIIRE
jgi:hypothetical protein